MLLVHRVPPVPLVPLAPLELLDLGVSLDQRALQETLDPPVQPDLLGQKEILELLVLKET